MENNLNKILGWSGRMISGSKSSYSQKHPNNFVIFNANICTEKKKIWYGDLDLTLDKNTLLGIVVETNETLYVFYEMDARFDKENKFNIKDAAAIFNKNGTAEVGEKYKEYYKL